MGWQAHQSDSSEVHLYSALALRLAAQKRIGTSKEIADKLVSSLIASVRDRGSLHWKHWPNSQ